MPQDTRYSRALFLKAATDALSDRAERSYYDSELRKLGGQSSLLVSENDLPGAIALLQEAGEWEATLAIVKKQLLSDEPLVPHLSAQEQRDLATSGALAAVDMAAEASAGGEGARVRLAFYILQQQAGLLREHDGAVQVMQQVVQMQLLLAPAYVMEVLTATAPHSSTDESSSAVTHSPKGDGDADGASRSDDQEQEAVSGPAARPEARPPGAEADAKEERNFALQVLQGLLWGTTAEQTQFGAGEQLQLLDQVRPFMTAQEQVGCLMAWLQSKPPGNLTGSRSWLSAWHSKSYLLYGQLLPSSE